MALISLNDISKVYKKGEENINALSGVSLDVNRGDFISIMGPSGSGKSTLLYLIGLMDRASSGAYSLNGVDVGGMDDDQMSRVRNKSFGFIFQSFNLFPQLTTVENIEVPMMYAGVPPHARRKKAEALAAKVGLSHRIRHRPTELSGGEMQRAAVARALANDPDVLLADEPTGNLDTATSAQIMGILGEFNVKGVALVVITHNDEIGRTASRQIKLRDGRVALCQ
jgi:putative ABC transport system ATP-binding protein